MAFTKDEAKEVIKSLERIETSLEHISPQVKYNTRFRWMTLGIVGFLITVKDYLRDWMFR